MFVFLIRRRATSVDALRVALVIVAVLTVGLLDAVPVYASARPDSGSSTESDSGAAESDSPKPAPRPTPRTTPKTTVADEIDVVETSTTANRVETPTGEVGSSITVLDREDIERHQWSTVADALRSVPGLDVSATGGPGQVTSVFVRGGSSSQVLVLLDGVRVNSATTGAYDFADLTTDSVERIEIVRGPQSTLYGSEAASGVISISTRRAPSEDVEFSGRIEGGEDDHRRVELSAAGRRGAFDYRLALADHHTDGISAADARRGNPELDAWSNTTASARLGWRLGAAGEAGRLDVDLRHLDSEAEVDGFAFPAGAVDDLDARNLRRAAVAGVTLRLTPTDRWTQTVQVAVSDDELRGEDPTDPFGQFVIESETLQASTRTDLRFGSRNARKDPLEQTLSMGAEWESRDGGTVGTFSDDVEIVSVYAQDHVSLGRFHLTLGTRHDDHSQFGGETTWRAAFAVDASASGRLHGSWGTGFKAPTLNDLFFPGFSNPDLLPETSEGVDLGYEHRFGDRWSLDVTAFDLDFENLIAFDFATFLPQNVAAATSRGVELQVAYAGAAVDLRAHHTWNETEDAATGAQLARRPEHRSVVDVGWKMNDAWRVATRLLAVADRIDSDGTPLEDYERLDLTVETRLGERWRPYVRVVNLLDEEYSEVGGFGTRGVTTVVGLRLTR